MMILVVVIFAICWLPTHVYFLVSNYIHSIRKYEYIQQIYIVIYLMAMSNSMYNPIIYCWMNSRYRDMYVFNNAICICIDAFYCIAIGSVICCTSALSC